MAASSASVLVTGGAGFIGSHFVRRCVLAEQATVVNLDKLTYAGHLASLADVIPSPWHHFVPGDVTDGPLLQQLLSEHRPHRIVHFAAETHVDRSIDSPPAFFETNVRGTLTLLEACYRYWRELPEPERQAFRLLHISTDEVYGSVPEPQEFHPDSPYAPNSPYAASKAAADHFVRAYRETYGLPTITVSSTNNYGPCQFPEKLIPRMIQHALAGERLPLFGDGQHVREWLHVEDNVNALLAILERGPSGAVYLVGSGERWTNLQVVESICESIDRLAPDLPQRPCRSLIATVTDRPGHDRRYAVDSSLVRNGLGWRPQIALKDGIPSTVQWYLQNRQWTEQVLADLDPAEESYLGNTHRHFD